MAKLRKIKRSPTYQAKRDKAAKALKKLKPHMSVANKRKPLYQDSDTISTRHHHRGAIKRAHGVKHKTKSYGGIRQGRGGNVSKWRMNKLVQGYPDANPKVKSRFIARNTW